MLMIGGLEKEVIIKRRFLSRVNCIQKRGSNLDKVKRSSRYSCLIPFASPESNLSYKKGRCKEEVNASSEDITEIRWSEEGKHEIRAGTNAIVSQGQSKILVIGSFKPHAR